VFVIKLFWTPLSTVALWLVNHILFRHTRRLYKHGFVVGAFFARKDPIPLIVYFCFHLACFIGAISFSLLCYGVFALRVTLISNTGFSSFSLILIIAAFLSMYFAYREFTLISHAYRQLTSEMLGVAQNTFDEKHSSKTSTDATPPSG
jgi:hypothetical protein